MNDHFGCKTPFEPAPGTRGWLYSLPALERRGLGAISRLPVSLRIVLESLLRNCDGVRVREEDVRALAAWRPNAPRTEEVPFVVARVLLQDFTGVPLLVDLAAMREAARAMGREPELVEPLVPVDLVIDHSVQVDSFGTSDSLRHNLTKELARNRARYEFLKWGTQAFETLKIVPPGVGICHQVNLEYLAKGVLEKEGVWYPDSLVGTDSHTTMINGLGVVGWGVGGIEAEAGMLGQPVYSLMPDVVGVHLTGALRPGVTATDLVLRVTELLRQTKVVGKFVEFHGEGAASLTVPDRATLGNMAPEYGATMGYFPVDERCCEYLLQTGRSPAHVAAYRAYYSAQNLFGMPRAGACDYRQVVELDLSTIRPSVAGPKRPQDRIELEALPQTFRSLLSGTEAGGYGRSAEASGARHPVALGSDGERAACSAEAVGGGAQDCDLLPDGRAKGTNTLTETEMVNNRPTPNPLNGGRAAAMPKSSANAPGETLGDGDVVIAAITSCTNTSNPSVMLAAGLLAKRAVERGLKVRASVKTSLAPGSRVVSDYLAKTGLQTYLDALGFNLVGYGCTTCIGNSGPLAPELEAAISEHGLVTASVLSGNRNFEARIHQSVKANFLMSPPLVVAFALAGRIDLDLTSEPLGVGSDGREVFLRDLWPSSDEVAALLAAARDAGSYRRLYGGLYTESSLWDAIPSASGASYAWDATSTYIRHPPYFENFSLAPTPRELVKGARILALFGDSLTTDHISPAGAIKPSAPAGRWLNEQGVAAVDFNSYGARRGNHEVMVRGTFANVRLKNLMVPGSEGGVTRHHPSGKELSIFDAAVEYRKSGTPLVIFGGQEYGTGSSRDWAAKGTRLLGVRAVVAQSFERIHRSNLVGMGVLPCQLLEGTSAASLGLDGSEEVSIEAPDGNAGIGGPLTPGAELTLLLRRRGGATERIPVVARIDTPIEVEYYAHGGILPFVLRRLLAQHAEEGMPRHPPAGGEPANLPS